MHGAGNDYIYIDCTSTPAPDSPADLAREMSDRHFGAGGDGIVLILPSECANFRMRMFNADGSEAQMCGNASRCVGKYVYDNGLTGGRTRVTLETLAGIKILDLHPGADGKIATVTVDMGEPVTRCELIPVVGQGCADFVDTPMATSRGPVAVTAVSMGNPHGVVFTEGELTDDLVHIAERLLTEIRSRLRFLIDVGLGYLTLDRTSSTLSGGESQRINLATSLGSSLVGSLYILDEPSIGLHSRDTERLISVLKRLQRIGNTVVVVEHDEEIMEAADSIIDVGPAAGSHGGEIVYSGPVIPAPADTQSLTLRYLDGSLAIPVPTSRRKWRDYVEIKGATEHNLKNIDVKVPLDVLTVVTGVSGSGKSTLVRDILYRHLALRNGDNAGVPGACKSVSVSRREPLPPIFVDQNSIGKSTRSNPATYLKAFDEIRRLFAEQPAAKQQGYPSGYFSFNVEGGRCERCKGEGTITIEMQFMADITIECEECHGLRYKRNVLDIRYRGKNISDVLDMTVDDAIEFFGSADSDDNTAHRIARRLKPLADVGLGYIKLGQNSSTLSGGENQRVKLAYYLMGESLTGRSMFIFDEPTTGLHFHDIRRLMESLNRLVEQGHTVVIIEHNMDVIKCADHVIDIGPEGGEAGGNVVATGTPEQIAACPDSYTGRYLKAKL